MHRHILAAAILPLLIASNSPAYVTTFAREIGPGNPDGTRWEWRFVPPSACQCGALTGRLDIPGLGVSELVTWVGGGWLSSDSAWFYGGGSPYDTWPAGTPHELMYADFQTGGSYYIFDAPKYIYFRNGKQDAPSHGGDYNYDGTIDAADAGVLFGGWDGHAADITGDDYSDAADAGVIFAKWSGDSSPRSVPEPSSFWLMFPALGFLKSRQRRRQC